MDITTFPSYVELNDTFATIRYAMVTSALSYNPFRQRKDYAGRYVVNGQMDDGVFYHTDIERLITDEQEILMLKLEGRLP